MRYEKVMIVDDAPIDRMVAERIIKKQEFAEEIVAVESAIDALNYLKEESSIPSKLPAVIFLDINMPEMNGFDFLEQYDKLSDTIKDRCFIVMLTSSQDPLDIDRADNSPYVSKFISKPLTLEKLNNIQYRTL